MLSRAQVMRKDCTQSLVGSKMLVGNCGLSKGVHFSFKIILSAIKGPKLKIILVNISLKFDFFIFIFWRIGGGG